eukprot:6182432-Pleurochrysis_carterae.AAC.1
MAKSLRSKVKKRLRTVKRGVIKKQLADPQTKLGAGPAKVMEKLKEAGSGFIKPGTRCRMRTKRQSWIPSCARIPDERMHGPSS